VTARGVLAIFNNVAAGRDAEFNAWFQGEHLAERLSVPGFLYGRRHKALSGAFGYLNFYVVESPEVLTSKPYLDRLDNPTPRTRVTMSEIFRDMCRTACRRDLRIGRARGAVTVAARFALPQDVTKLRSALEQFGRDETIAGELWLSAEKPGAIMEEEKLRGGDRKIAQCLLVDTLDERSANAVAEQIARDFAGAEIGVFRVISHLGNADA